MQKQLNLKPSIRFGEVTFDNGFPLVFFTHIQRHHPAEYLHYHSSAEIGCCTSGSGVFFIGDMVLEYAAGDIVVIPSPCPHIAQSPLSQPSEWMFLNVDLGLFLANPAFSDLSAALPLVPAIYRPPNNRLLSDIFQAAISALSAAGHSRRQASLHLVSAFLYELQAESDLPQSTFSSQTEFQHIAPAINHISSFYPQQITVRELADTCHLSESYFRSLFKSITGLTPHAYLNQTRIAMAKTLLSSSSLPITEISLSIGYATISTFNRCFKNATGVSPSAYRARHLPGSTCPA